jgi:hypothetical protein
VKQTFLLDENILYLAIKEVDEHDRPDMTAAQLVRLIGQNCHRITGDQQLRKRYYRHLEGLLGGGKFHLHALLFIKQILHNSAKSLTEVQEPPELPEGIVVPREDTHIVRAAMISHPLIVTSDAELKDRINSQPVLGLQALTPREAIGIAEQT